MAKNDKEKKKRRKPGDWSFSERPGRKGQWVARKQFGKKENGKPNIIALYGHNISEVEQKAKEYDAKLLTNQLIKIPNLTVYSYVKNWIETKKRNSVKQKTYDGLEDALEVRLKPYDIANMSLKNISDENCQDYIDQRTASDKKYSIATIRKSYSLLNAAFKYAVKKKKLYSNPMELVEMPSEAVLENKTKKIMFFTEEQIAKIIIEANLKYSNGKPHYFYGLLIEVLARTGLRINEALALIWRDIDLKNKTLSVSKTLSEVKYRNKTSESDKNRIIIKTYPKTDKSVRVVKLSPKAVLAFENLKRQSQMYGLETGCEDNVFQTQNGNSVSYRNVQRTLDSILKNIGINDQRKDKAVENQGHYTLHALRHTFATNLLMNGIDIHVVSALLGHKKVSTTYNIYIHVIESQEGEALDKLDDIM